ncbi:MAG: hypothetical protein R6V85_02580 [Polyangia bacterium]
MLWRSLVLLVAALALLVARDCLAAGEEAAAEGSSSPVDVSFDPGSGLIMTAADGALVLKPIGIAQPLFTARIAPSSDDPVAGSGFTLRRGALGFDARLWSWARVFFTANIGRGRLELWDYFVEIDPLEGALALRAGRFRPWLGRQRLMGCHKYQFVQLSRAMTGLLQMGDGRDLGVGLHGMLGETLEYGLGAWNGEWSDFAPQSGDSTPEGVSIPPNRGVQLGGRLAVHPLSPLPLGEEPDLAASPEPRMVLAAAAIYNPRHDRTLNLPAFDRDVRYEDHLVQLGGEAAFKWRGLSAVAELFLARAWLDEGAAPEIADRHRSQGLDEWGVGTYAQLGWFVVEQRLELAARFDFLDTNAELRGADLYPAGGVNLYLVGYLLELQLMYRATLAAGYGDDDPGRPATAHDVFLMLQAAI